MRFQPWGSVCLLVLSFAALLLAAPCVLGDEPAASAIADPAEAGIRAALDKRVSFELVNVPLSDVAESMAEALGIDVILDERALEDAGVERDTPLSRSISEVSARSFLRLALRKLDLTFMIRDSALVITTFEEAESQLITRIYPVGDIVPPRSDDAGLAECGGSLLTAEQEAGYDLLIEAITSSIYPDTWDEVGGPGSIEGIYSSLVISQTDDVHELIEALLLRYRQVIKADASPDGLGVQPWMVGHDGQAYLRPALEKTLTAIIRDEPLGSAAAKLAKEFQVPIVVDWIALEDSGIDTESPVTGRFAEVPLRAALKRLLDPVGLTYTLRHESVLITTPEQDEAMLQLALYPVGNLVRDGSDDPADYDFDSLIQVIISAVATNSWDEVGGPGSIHFLLPAPVLLVSQTHDVHQQIAKLLVTLEAAKRQVPEKEAVDPDAITLKAYQPLLGFFDSESVVAIIVRDSKEDTWEPENVFIEPLGPAIIVKHNAQVHARVKKILKELGVWWHPNINSFQGGGGTGFGSGGAANGQPQAGAGQGAPGGFF